MEMNETMIVKKYGLSGFQLKWIAVCSMLIDHFGSIVMDGVLAPYKHNGIINFTDDMPFFVRNAFNIKSFCEILGSIAFPIFCFLIVQGFMYTRSRLRYGLLLGAFALISEIPYDVAHYQQMFDLSLQNVLFTLCIGVFTLYAITFAEKQKRAVAVFLTILFIVLGCGISFLMRSEYVFLGITSISLLYLFRNTKWQVAGIVPLLVASPWILLSVPFLILYNGKRGCGSKYFFYIFYPSHFLLFAGIAYLLEIR